jgi:hypothetical protein
MYVDSNRIDLSHIGLGDTVAELLAKALNKLPSLECLILRDNQLHDAVSRLDGISFINNYFHRFAIYLCRVLKLSWMQYHQIQPLYRWIYPQIKWYLI